MVSCHCQLLTYTRLMHCLLTLSRWSSLIDSIIDWQTIYLFWLVLLCSNFNRKISGEFTMLQSRKGNCTLGSDLIVSQWSVKRALHIAIRVLFLVRVLLSRIVTRRSGVSPSLLSLSSISVTRFKQHIPGDKSVVWFLSVSHAKYCFEPVIRLTIFSATFAYY